MRRPAPPRLQAGRPGAPAAARAPVGPPTSAPIPASAPAATPRTPSRRVLLLAGAAAAAVTGAVSAGTLLSRGDGAATAASVGGGGAMDAAAPRNFSDVPDDDEGRAAMEWADATGVQPALEGSRYAPSEPVTRGDLALALHRFAGSPAVPLDHTPALLTDLGEDPDRAAALLWLHGQGALWGDASLRVHPERTATRDAVAGVLAALLRPALAGVGATWDPAADASLPHAVEPWSALAQARWLETAGVLSGAPDESEGAGEERTTRGDLALCLHRADSVISAALA